MKRQDISQNSKWKLEDIFQTEELWEEAFIQLKENAGLCLKYKGELKTADSVYNCLKDNETISMMAEKLFAYAKMKQDEDTRDSKYKKLSDKIENLYVSIMSNN